MKVGSKVIIKYSNPLYSEKWYQWQPYEIMEIRKQATGTITRIRGLCVPTVSHIGYSIDDLEEIK